MDNAFRRGLSGLIAASLTGLLVACSSAPQQAEQPAQKHPQAAEKPKQNDIKAEKKQAFEPALPNVELSKELLYQLLLAEIAGYRGEIGVAIQNYLIAAQQTRDPRMAERAVRIALYGGDNKAAKFAAKLWVDVSPRDVDAHLMLGLLYLREQAIQQASDEFQFVIDNHQASKGKAVSVVGAHLLREKDKQAALQALTIVAKNNASVLEVHYALSKMAEQAGDLKLAQSSIENALLLEEHVTELQVQYARILSLQGKTSQAIEYLKNATTASPEDRILRLTYARILLEERKLDAARQQFEFLLEKSPGNSDILYALGILGLQNNDLESAETYFKQLSSKDKRSAEANYYLGQIAERRGDLQEAIDWFSQIKNGSYYVESQLRIATLKVKVEGLEPALKYLRTIQVQGKKQQVRLLLAEGEIIREAGDYPRAMRHFDAALDEHPNNTDLLYARALIAEKIDRLDILMRDLQAILDVKPDHAHALNALGYTLADRTARYKEALKYIQRALELKPNDAAVVDSMGWVQYRLGNYDQSISYLRRALQMNRDAEIAAHLGEVLLANGNKDEAHDVIKTGLEISPDNKQLLELLKQIQP